MIAIDAVKVGTATRLPQWIKDYIFLTLLERLTLLLRPIAARQKRCTQLLYAGVRFFTSLLQDSSPLKGSLLPIGTSRMQPGLLPNGILRKQRSSLLNGKSRMQGALSLWSALFLAFLLLAGCTTASWVVDEEPVTDPESEQVLSEQLLHLPVNKPTPQYPVLTLDFVKERELSYNRHLISKRYIQQYRPRYGYLVLGLSGMGLGLFLANTSVVDADALSGRERALLNITSLSIGTASFLSMKPEDEPRPAGEERLLQKTGTWAVNDTIPADIPDNSRALISINRGDDTLVVNREILFSENRLMLDLIRETELQRLDVSDTTGLQVRVSFGEHTYEQYVPVSDIMQQYVEIAASNTPLRTAPATLSNNIIRHVGSESSFPFLRDMDDRWYRILKSDGSAYVAKEQSRLIWQSVDPATAGEHVIPTDQPVFGDLVIERDLPENMRANPDGIAIVIINGAYSDPVRVLPNASRTSELVTLYLSRVLGYYSDNIRVFENLTEQEMRSFLEESDSLLIGGRYLTADESDLFFYYYGHAFSDENDRLHLIPVDYDPSERTERTVPFDDFAQTIGSVRSRNSVVVMDTDWARSSVFGLPTNPSVRTRSSLIEEVSEEMLDRMSRGAIFWAAQPGQYTGAYAGSNGRTRFPFDIFTWYFFKALQDGASTAGEIEQYLERNVPFTSRRLHDRAQNSGFYGNRELILINRP